MCLCASQLAGDFHLLASSFLKRGRAKSPLLRQALKCRRPARLNCSQTILNHPNCPSRVLILVWVKLDGQFAAGWGAPARLSLCHTPALSEGGTDGGDTMATEGSAYFQPPLAMTTLTYCKILLRPNRGWTRVFARAVVVESTE